MNIILSLVFLAALIGVIAWIRSRGFFQHVGCTCRDPGDAAHEHPPIQPPAPQGAPPKHNG